MELFLPSMAVLLVASLIVFLVLPRIGAPLLAMLSMGLLILVYIITTTCSTPSTVLALGRSN